MANLGSVRGRRQRTPYGWLGAGALIVGVWAALAGGVAVAHAEGPAADSSSGSVVRGASATAKSVVAPRTSRAAGLSLKVPRGVVGRGGRAGPAGPAGPVAPVRPVSPFAPAGPVAPSLPFVPAAPSVPAGPATPAGPAGPIGPAAE